MYKYYWHPILHRNLGEILHRLLRAPNNNGHRQKPQFNDTNDYVIYNVYMIYKTYIYIIQNDISPLSFTI